ncbi:hypothetical protein ACFV9E_11755 [Streptomyces sp. NPDC059835]|uniref:hypothetical protein n=1 Tax=Streptomyces sp. NPDC059835 TaxID=3346967 RepID=UPI00365C192E
MHKHSRQALSDGITPLGAALEEIADAIESAVEDDAELDIATALTTEPEAIELAALTDRLITHCKTLAVGLGEIPLAQRSTRAVGALRDWSDLASAGPEADTRHEEANNPAYARMLALIARSMLKALREHRSPRAFVGRTALPPIAPGQGDQ